MEGQMGDASLKKTLLCIQKFCTDKVCFQGLAPDEQVAQFQDMTNHLLSDELKKKSPDAETVETLAANYTLVMTNAMSEKCRQNKHLSFVTDDYDAGLAAKAIDNHFKLSWKYKASEIILKRNQKRRKILVTVLISFIIIGLILLAGSLIFNNKSVQAREEANNITKNVSIIDWATGIFGGNQERAVKEASLLSSADNSQNMSGVLGFVGGGIFVILFALIITAQRAIKSSRKVLNDWDDYRHLCDYLELSAQKATEAKNLWQY